MDTEPGPLIEKSGGRRTGAASPLAGDLPAALRAGKAAGADAVSFTLPTALRASRF
jgi:hypothetical protein